MNTFGKRKPLVSPAAYVASVPVETIEEREIREWTGKGQDKPLPKITGKGR